MQVGFSLVFTQLFQENRPFLFQVRPLVGLPMGDEVSLDVSEVLCLLWRQVDLQDPHRLRSYVLYSEKNIQRNVKS